MGLFDGLLNALSGGSNFKAAGGGPGYQGPVGGGGGLSWPLLSMMLGQMGAAISPRGSWQQNLGGVASNWARSNIYANAAAKVQPNFDDFIKSIMGQGVTPPGTPGPTSVAMNDKGEYEVKGSATQPPPQQTQIQQQAANYPPQQVGGNYPFP